MNTTVQLNYGWLADLTNPHHDNTTQQIDDCVSAFNTDNARFLAKAAKLHQCRQKEDEVWLKVQRDPVVKQLETADNLQDDYMIATRTMIQAYASLPDVEPTKAEAKECEQVFKDFKFRTNEAMGAEADKIIQMEQNFQEHEAFLTLIGAWAFLEKAVEQAQLVRQLLLARARTKGEFVKGEMQTARKATDAAVADLYKTIYAMMDLMPSTELTDLYNQLHGIELYAKQYYIPGANGSSNGNGQGTTSPDPSEGGENGGDDNGGGTDTPPSGGDDNGGTTPPSGGGDDNGGDDNGGETPPPTAIPTLTITKQGTGTSTVTIAGNAVNSGSQIAAGTQVDIQVTPAYGQTPTATLDGQEVELTQNASVYEGSFQMPQTDATLVINSGSTGGGGVDQN